MAEQLSISNGLANESIFISNTSSDHETVHPYVPPPLEALSFYPWQVLLISIYSTTALVSLSSNVLTIIILLRGEHVSTELWKFLLNLSLADILMATFCIPFTYTVYMLGRWILPNFLCPIVSFVQVASVSVSVLTLTAIGIDRYFAIIYPFRPLLWMKSHKFTMIAFIWLLGCAIAFPQIVNSGTVNFKYQGEEFYDCREISEETSKMYTIFLLFATFVIPIATLIFVYTSIGVHLWRNSATPGNPDQNRDKVCIGKKIKVIKMLITIVVLFAVCWLPTHIFQTLVWFLPGFQNQKTNLQYYTYVGTYFVTHWLSMAHSCVNPFVYCFMSDNFRMSLRSTLSKCCIRFKRYEVDDFRDVTMTQVQSVTMMQTASLQSTPRAESTAKVVCVNSATGNGTNNHNYNCTHQLQIDDEDDFV